MLLLPVCTPPPPIAAALAPPSAARALPPLETAEVDAAVTAATVALAATTTDAVPAAADTAAMLYTAMEALVDASENQFNSVVVVFAAGRGTESTVMPVEEDEEEEKAPLQLESLKKPGGHTHV